MTLKQMAIAFNTTVKAVREAAEFVNGGPLGKGRRKWTPEQERQIEDIVSNLNDWAEMEKK